MHVGYRTAIYPFNIVNESPRVCLNLTSIGRFEVIGRDTLEKGTDPDELSPGSGPYPLPIVARQLPLNIPVLPDIEITDMTPSNKNGQAPVDILKV
jgi:hypothetical protein